MTRLESRQHVRSDRPMIHLEITEFYADAPVIPGSMARAIESVRSGEVIARDTPQHDRSIRNDSAAWRPPSGSNSKSAAAPTDSGHSNRMPVSQELPRSMPFRRDPLQIRSPYTPGNAPGSIYSPSIVQPYYSTTGPSLAGLQDKSITPTSRLPLTLPRIEDEAVYRRMNHSERNRADSRLTPDIAAMPRQQQQWIRDGNARHTSGGEMPLPPVRNVKILPRENNQPQPQVMPPRSNQPQAGPAVQPLLPRAGLIQPLPPSRFTAQMHIPPFRAGVGQE